jgi:glycosyltransferase involved in cell wall biosynthesis
MPADVTMHAGGLRTTDGHRARPGRSPRIVVLLATLNGEAFLDEQIASLAAQDVLHLDVVASDDGSTDLTLSILRNWQARWTKGTFTIVSGPGQNFAENFRGLICLLDDHADYVAFADQDDVWDTDKLSAAIRALEGEAGPALYGGRTRLVDARLQPLGSSPLFGRPPHFRNAIVQSLAGGNTMVLNRAGFALVSASARRTRFVSHDWWCYLIVSGAGGRVHYDPVPRIAYRQHASNAIGESSGIRARLHRLQLLVDGQFRRWNDANLAALDACADMLTEETRATLEQFRSIRSVGPIAGLWILWSSGIYRQLFGSRLTLAIAALLRKV